MTFSNSFPLELPEGMVKEPDSDLPSKTPEVDLRVRAFQAPVEEGMCPEDRVLGVQTGGPASGDVPPTAVASACMESGWRDVLLGGWGQT